MKSKDHCSVDRHPKRNPIFEARPTAHSTVLNRIPHCPSFFRNASTNAPNGIAEKRPNVGTERSAFHSGHSVPATSPPMESQSSVATMKSSEDHHPKRCHTTAFSFADDEGHMFTCSVPSKRCCATFSKRSNHPEPTSYSCPPTFCNAPAVDAVDTVDTERSAFHVNKASRRGQLPLLRKFDSGIVKLDSNDTFNPFAAARANCTSNENKTLARK